jgi:mRNA interferase MazF
VSTVTQWAIYRATLDPVIGSEQRGTRPVLVISHNDFNRLMPTVTILPLTSHKPGRRVYLNEVLLPSGTAGLPSASLGLVHQIRTVAKSRLSTYYGVIDDIQLRQAIIRALQVHLPYGT